MQSLSLTSSALHRVRFRFLIPLFRSASALIPLSGHGVHDHVSYLYSEYLEVHQTELDKLYDVDKILLLSEP